VNTKCDWLICGHVTSDKCNVSRRATSEKLLPAPTGYVRFNFQVYVKIKNVKEEKNTQQATGYAAETV
jgi:uncharacterized membrane-anchored protein